MTALQQLRGASVDITEVGPRDGLQNEATAISTADKVAFVDRLSESGLHRIEVASFVSARWVPQMADAAEVFARITRRPGVVYSALALNVSGFERALAAKADAIAVVVSATETFSRRNANCSQSDALARAAAIARAARESSLPVRAYVSVAFGCPYEGAVPVSTVASLAAQLLDCGADEIALSDTIGIAQPGQVETLIQSVVPSVPIDRLALHCHDTRGMALANVLTGLILGIRRIDGSAGGLGGCPFAPGAAGNLATDDLVYLLDGLAVETGVSLAALMRASAFIERCIGHAVPSRQLQAARVVNRG